MTKTCYACKNDLPLEAFNKNATRKDGLQPQCKSCQKGYKDKHYAANKSAYLKKNKKWSKTFRAWYQDYKKQFHCARCPESHPACIQFHHPKKNKLDSVSALLCLGSKQKVIDEITKCVPLCANCHAKEHYKVSVVECKELSK